MNSLRQSKGLFGILLVIGLALIIALFFTIQITTNSPTTMIAAPQSIALTPSTYVTFTAAPGAPSAPGGVSILELSATPIVSTKKEPPPCTFPLPQTTTIESTPQQYTFSEPKVVLTSNPDHAGLNIVGWLPDNQRALLVQDFQDSSQNMEILDTKTGFVQVYSHQAANPPPIWVDRLNAIVYPQTILLSGDAYESNGVIIIPTLSVDRRQLLLSRGDPTSVQSIEDAQVNIYNGRLNTTGAMFNVTVNSDGSQIAYIDEYAEQLHLREISQGSLQAAEQLPLNATSSWGAPVSLSISWRPNTTQIFLYNHFSQVGIYAYLFNIQSRQACKISLYENEALASLNDYQLMSATWSPNGRYLAVVRKDGPPMVTPTDLIILDTTTGKLYQMNADKFSPSGMESTNGIRNVENVAWAPDNRHLLVIGYLRSCPSGNQNCFPYSHLYVVDFITGQVNPVLPAYQFNMNDFG